MRRWQSFRVCGRGCAGGEFAARCRTRAAARLPALIRAAPPLPALGLLATCLLAGCFDPQLDDTYGRRRGTPGAHSVNGTAVLAGMWERAGHRVTTWRRLSPRLHDFSTIVWVPDDFAPPNSQQRGFLEEWLSAGGKTLIYIGRDYDAAVDYWQWMLKTQPRGDVAQRRSLQRRLAHARARHDAARLRTPDEQYCRWFTVRRDGPRVAAQSLEGPWSLGIDAAGARLQLATRLDPPRPADLPQKGDQTLPRITPLLVSQEQVLVSQVEDDGWPESKIVVVNNGCFLLNMPLVNPEHRKLAARLVATGGPPGKVAFLEHGPSELRVYDEEPAHEYPSGFTIFQLWPVWPLALHAAWWGLLICLALFPLFGRPRELPAPATGDFGKHVQALGQLLERSRDRQYAGDCLRQYQEAIQRDSGGAGRCGTRRAAAAWRPAVPDRVAAEPTAGETSGPQA